MLFALRVRGTPRNKQKTTFGRTFNHVCRFRLRFILNLRPIPQTSPNQKPQTITPQSPLDATTLQQQAPLRARRAHPGRQTRGRRRAISSEDELFLFRSLSFQGSGCKGSPGLTVRVQGIGASQPMAPASTSPTPKPNLSCQNEAEYDLRSKLLREHLDMNLPSPFGKKMVYHM